MPAYKGDTRSMSDRYLREEGIANWVNRAFGRENATNLEQRGLRLAEEVIELCQAVDCDKEQLHRLIDYVYSRPVGSIRQEAGGVGITLVALCRAAGFSADAVEVAEFKRVLAIPLEKFAARNDEKNNAGFKARSNNYKAEHTLPPIPERVYWHTELGDFYDAVTGKSMGSCFHNKWRNRSYEFPENCD